MTVNEHGFVVHGKDEHGIFAVGCSKNPADVAKSVQDSTAAALKAIQTIRRNG